MGGEIVLQYFLGVDAGGTNTIAIITNESGDVLGTGIGGNGNHQIDYVIARESIHRAVEEALKIAKLEKDDLTFSYFGLAGADRPVDFDILRPLIDELELPQYEIACDTYIALRAGVNQPFGVVIICGTGVNCSGIGIDGKQYQCGGFNYLHGDFGGGSGLAQEVYRSVIRAWDGRGQETILSSLLLDYLRYESVEEMFHDFLDHRYEVPADCAKLLFQAVQQGDKVAQEILIYQGKELGLSAKAVIERLQLHNENFDIVLAGSILTRSSDDIIMNEIRRVVEKVAPHCTLKILEAEPVVGSLLLAMEAAHVPVDEATYHKLHQIKKVKVG